MIFNRTSTYRVQHDGHTLEFRRPTLQEQNSELQAGGKVQDRDQLQGMDSDLVMKLAEQITSRLVRIDDEPQELDAVNDIIPAMPIWEISQLWAKMAFGGGMTAEEKRES